MVCEDEEAQVRQRAAIVGGAVRNAGVALIATALMLVLVTATTAVALSVHPGGRMATVRAAVEPDQPLTPSESPVASPAASPSPSPSATRIPRPHHLIAGTVLVTTARRLTSRQIAAVRHLSGVTAVEVVDAGRASVDRRPAEVLGVDPMTFRPWTPQLTAASDPLWQSIARGELTASFDMGHEAKLPLGDQVPVAAHRTASVRVGAFASMGMAGVDAIVDEARAARLGLPQDNALLVSAPSADPLALRTATLQAVGAGASASLLRDVVVIRDAGSFLTRAQVSTVLKVAAAQVGKPYLWGGAGPDSFDCSGLVQWTFAHIGVRMPRVSQEQFFTGPHVAYADARAGDLLFWHYDPTDPTDVDHVAIYAGNGMMLVAPHTGLDVEYVPVPLNDLAGVVRVDPAMAAALA